MQTNNLCYLNRNTVILNISSRFPNLTVAVFTRESVREALKRGITADQVVYILCLRVIFKPNATLRLKRHRKSIWY